MNEIKSRLLDYLVGEQSFVAFQEWLTALSWAPANLTAADLELVHELELRVAEFTGGYISEEELRAVLSEAAGFIPHVVRHLWRMENAPVSPQAPVQRTGSSLVRRSAAFS